MLTWEQHVASITVYLAWALSIQVPCIHNAYDDNAADDMLYSLLVFLLCSAGDSDIIKTLPGDH